MKKQKTKTKALLVLVAFIIVVGALIARHIKTTNNSNNYYVDAASNIECVVECNANGNSDIVGDVNSETILTSRLNSDFINVRKSRPRYKKTGVPNYKMPFPSKTIR